MAFGIKHRCLSISTLEWAMSNDARIWLINCMHETTLSKRQITGFRVQIAYKNTISIFNAILRDCENAISSKQLI